MLKINYPFKLLVLAVCLHLLGAGQAFCGAPLKINFQGRLDENGQPAAGSKTFVFKIYDAVSGGSLVWTSAAQPLTLSDGVFSALLAAGDTTALSTATFAAARFVELSVDGVTLSPRQEMVSAPYALVAQALAADADIPPTAIAAGSVTDAKVLLTTAAITSGRFSDDRVGVSTGAIVSGLFGDDRVNLSTGAITAGVFSDERIRISTGAFYADFNGPYQLLQLDSVGRFPATFVGDGALSANVLVSSVAVGKIYGGAIQDNAVTDAKVYLTTSAIASGRFGDMRVRISTGAVMLGRFSDDRVLITTGAFVSDEQLEAAAFNAPYQLVRLSAAGALPAVDGSALTNVPASSYSGSVAAAQVSAGALGDSVISSSVGVSSVHSSAIQPASVTDAKVLLTTAAISSGRFGDGMVLITTGAFAALNGPDQLVKLDDAGRLAAALPYKVLTRVDGVFDSYDALSGDHTFLVDSSDPGGSFVVNLPDASLVPGKVYSVKRTDLMPFSGGPVTVRAFPPQQIDGSDSLDINTTEWECLTIQSNGSGWSVLSWYKPS